MVEPFAGSAGYAVRYASAKVILSEVDPVIYGVWDYLILGQARGDPADPEPSGRRFLLRTVAIPQEARWLVGFWMI